MPGVRKTTRKAIVPPKKETVEDIRCKCPIKARTHEQILKEGNPRLFEEMIYPDLILHWNPHFKGWCREDKARLGQEYIKDNAVMYLGHQWMSYEPRSEEYLKLVPLIWGAPF